jgi:NADH-quinone oxidoreductase subunit G
MCIDICPVGALTSGTYRYQTRPWEMTYVSESLHALLERLQDNSERSKQRNPAREQPRPLGLQRRIPVRQGTLRFRLSLQQSRAYPPAPRSKNGKLEPASWEDALEEVAAAEASIHEKHGGQAVGVIGSNHTTNEENYLLNRLRASTLGTNNLDHHRTADYA